MAAVREVDFLLVGGGLAAGSCAAALRQQGAEGPILLVGREPDPPYDRPPLSKEYLRGEQSREDAYWRPLSFWEENDVELATRTSVMSIDPAARRAKLSSGEEVAWRRALLLATGANVRRLRVPGAELEGIHYLRTFGNADAIRADVEAAERVAYIGGSFIACECAASIVARWGKRCELLMLEQEPLERQFGTLVGRAFARVLRDHGVVLHPGEELERFEGDDRVRAVVAKSGLRVEADCVIVGAGVMPDVMLARRAGIELGETGGVRCDAMLRTSADGVFAAGDIAEYESPIHGRPIRVEHWDVALNHGRTAAANMLGQERPHDVVPYFFSDLADWLSIEYVGPGEGRPIVRGSLEEASFTVFYVEDGRVRAALTAGDRGQDLEHARRLIKEGATVDERLLADESSDLASLAAGGRAG